MRFRYLNAHVVPRHKYCESKIDFSKYGIDHDGKMVEVGQVMYCDFVR
jgi:hypothetical protein